MESLLRPYDLGATQWYVLHHLVNGGPTKQRDMVNILQVERATLSAIVGVLVRKGLVEQVPDSVDQRQKLLRLTAAGKRLWRELPDLSVIHRIAFGGLDKSAVAAAVRVLETATARLEKFTERK
jgi:DNA-binding MarR family transcriptional regulator